MSRDRHEDQGTVMEASHKLVEAADKLERALSAETCHECGDRARYHVGDDAYCRPCAWHANDGKQPEDDTDSEPPGAGRDYWGRPDPQTHPEAWME